MQTRSRRWAGVASVAFAFLVGIAICRSEARPRPSGASPAASSDVAIDADDIGGIVTSSNGPEAGVWVIAETADLGTRFREIVITNDRGRYLLPDLPKANYKVWVRGYGLVDSAPVNAAPGQELALAAVVAVTPRAAAEYYPASYWVSLLNVSSKSAFPMKLSGSPSAVIPTQADWLYAVKNCWGCHELGNKPTREIPASLGSFKTTGEAWERLISSGQLGSHMTRLLNSLGHEQGPALFGDWLDRIAAGELPPTPPRPQGIDRNVVATVWDWSVRASFLHAVISTDRRNPSVNASGPVYGDDWFAGALAVVDPVANTASMIRIPLANEEDRQRLPSWAPQTQSHPSMYFGDEIVWNAPLNPGSLAMDGRGRVWLNVQNRFDLPGYCKPGSNNPYAKYSPRESGGKGVDVYDPKTHKFEFVDLCVTAERLVFADDKDQTLYMAIKEGGLAWINTRVWDESHDSEKSQGWCPPVIDYNRDGKIGAYTTAPEPLDPKLDRAIASPGGDGVAYNPVDGSVWYTALNPRPGKLIRMVKGANPPSTCNAEVYELPYDPKGPGMGGSHPRGIDIGTDGVVWAPLAGEGVLARFDRRQCKADTGEAITTGRRCREGWTLYPIPGPAFKNQPDVKADFPFSMWLDRFNSLGLGRNIPIVDGADSDSLLAFIPGTKTWVRLQVPYPMGFSSHFFDARIDDPKTGWKGRGLWAANETTGSQLTEGGKDMPSQLAHFRIRPDPLAK